MPTAGLVQIGIVLGQLGQLARPAAQPEQLGHAPLVVQLELAASLLQLADIRHRLLNGLGIQHMVSVPKANAKGQRLTMSLQSRSHDANNRHVPRPNENPTRSKDSQASQHMDRPQNGRLTLRASSRLNVFLHPWHTFACDLFACSAWCRLYVRVHIGACECIACAHAMGG